MSYSSTDSAAVRTDTDSDSILTQQDSLRTRWSSSPLSSLPSGAQSPLRHHRRALSNGPREVIETLNAISLYDERPDGSQTRRVNQYLIKNEIGSGSFGSVFEAEDQQGHKFAIKEFSKNQLRKRARSNILRRARRPGRGPPGRQHQRSVSDIHDDEEGGNALNLIKEEIAIMKKLDHPNVVHLFEVLDVPEEDSLYMVVEMCSKGVVMKVGFDTQAEPYEEEQCRVWFRDLILGIEYLHAQGIIHRDIKPDNLLLTHDDVLKIGDFGVSEIFSNEAKMLTNKSSGSPAFMPPELCQSGHGSIDGTKADIWSMGITLYCLLFGRLPYQNYSVLELYNEICKAEFNLPETMNPSLVDLLRRVLERDPAKRIRMEELREHPWVTNNGTDTLLPISENTAHIAPPTEAEISSSITLSLEQVAIVVKAVHTIRRRLSRRFENTTHLTAESHSHTRSRSLDVSHSPSGRRERAQTFDSGGVPALPVEYLSASNLNLVGSPTGTMDSNSSVEVDGGEGGPKRGDSGVDVEEGKEGEVEKKRPKEVVVPRAGPSIEVVLVESPSEDFSFEVGRPGEVSR